MEEREQWVMMGTINLGAVLEYGRASSFVRQVGGFGGVKEATSVSTDIQVMATTTYLG